MQRTLTGKALVKVEASDSWRRADTIPALAPAFPEGRLPGGGRVVAAAVPAPPAADHSWTDAVAYQKTDRAIVSARSLGQARFFLPFVGALLALAGILWAYVIYTSTKVMPEEQRGRAKKALIWGGVGLAGNVVVSTRFVLKVRARAQQIAPPP